MGQTLNLRAKTIKLFEEKIGVNLYDLRFGDGFLDLMPPKNQQKYR